MKNNSELRGLSVIELNNELLSLRKLQFKMRIKRATDSLQQTHQITEARRYIARIKTIMAEKVGKSHVEN